MPEKSNAQNSTGNEAENKGGNSLLRQSTAHIEVEAGLTKFCGAYRPFLREMSDFATPITLKLLVDINKIPEGERRESPILKDTSQKAFDKLEAKAQEFSGEFDKLPVPSGAKVIKTQPYILPLTNLFVFRLDYGAFVLTFRHINEKINYGEQFQAWLSTSALPGSTLKNEVDLWLKHPVEPKWEYVQPRLLKTQNKQNVLYHGSADGHVERSYIDMLGMFWSSRLWVAKKNSEIKVKPSNALGLSSYTIGEAEFKLYDIGSGELDAFLRYVGNAAPAIARNKQPDN